MIAPRFATDYVIDVHLAFICATDLADPAITSKDSVALSSIPATVQLI
jgi:hypothetical protein